MLYQLSTGKVVYISDEEFCKLDDVEFKNLVQDLTAHNKGYHPSSMWHGSATRHHDNDDQSELDMRTFEESDSVEYKFNINDIPDEESEF
jgi:hypothetical protein